MRSLILELNQQKKKAIGVVQDSLNIKSSTGPVFAMAVHRRAGNRRPGPIEAPYTVAQHCLRRNILNYIIIILSFRVQVSLTQLD
jgi:hypothetical protein